MTRSLNGRQRALRRYHELTNHSPAGVASSAHRLDWSMRPIPFKVYRELEPMPPPADTGRLCRLSNGVLRWRSLDGRELTITSRDGTGFAAYAARAEQPSGAGVVIIPDVRGLHPYYEELALRFAEAGVHAAALDLYARSAATPRRGEGFEHEPHVMQLQPEAVNADVAARPGRSPRCRSASRPPPG